MNHEFYTRIPTPDAFKDIAEYIGLEEVNGQCHTSRKWHVYQNPFDERDVILWPRSTSKMFFSSYATQALSDLARVARELAKEEAA